MPSKACPGASHRDPLHTSTLPQVYDMYVVVVFLPHKKDVQMINTQRHISRIRQQFAHCAVQLQLNKEQNIAFLSRTCTFFTLLLFLFFRLQLTFEESEDRSSSFIFRLPCGLRPEKR